MTHHKVAPHDFLDFVHDVDRTVLDADPLLVAAIAGLPGRKFIFTNGDAPYAMRVLDRLGLGQSFEAIHDIHACGYAPKPTPSAYHGMIDSFGIDPARSLFVEDMARNLKRSEEHTSELQSLMRISYAVFCLKKKKTKTNKI